jgi:hypothetical protein
MRATRACSLTKTMIEGISPVADLIHKFQVGQTVDLIPSTFRAAAKGSYEIVRLVPVSAKDPQYRIKSKSEIHERVVSEGDLILSAQHNSVFS